jgi:hypothetical protein
MQKKRSDPSKSSSPGRESWRSEVERGVGDFLR